MMDKEEISDTDSGIILNSGPDSPTLPVRDLTTHTRVMRLKHQALEDRLELCLLDLKKLCIREAELTGKLSSDYPLLPDEKPPRVRRRIGATFKLDDSLIHQDGEDSELHSLEADLALQLQIVEAARRLSVEEHLSKPQKKSRLQQCKREDRKVKDLQEAVYQHRIRNKCSSPPTNKNNNTAKHRDLCISDDSSLSDAVALDDDSLSSSSSVDPLIQSSVGSLSLQSSSSQGSLHHTSAQSQSLGSNCGVEQTQTSSMGSSCSVEFPERSPIQNSPWRESNLDQSYLKPNTPLRSPVGIPVGTPVFPADSRVLPSHFPSIKNMALRHGQINSSSAPSTPELHLRRQYSLSFRLPRSKPTHDLGEGRGRARLPRRRPEFLVRSPQYAPQCLYQSSSEHSVPSYTNPQRLYQSSSEHSVPSYTNPQRLYQSSSEDSSSEHSLPSYTSPPSRDTDRDNHKDREGPASPEIPKLCPPPYGFHYGAQSPTSPALNGSSFHKKNNQHQSSPSLRRRMAEEGTCSPLSPQGLGSPLGKGLYLSPSRPLQPQQQHRHWQQGPPPSSPRRVLKPPPPYTRLVHTPSLREYPNQPARVLPREMLSDELKSWNQFQKSRPSSLERQGSFRVKSPTSPHLLPPYLQGPHQKRILQRAADGTPVQWFVEEDSEIVSQV